LNWKVTNSDEDFFMQSIDTFKETILSLDEAAKHLSKIGPAKSWSSLEADRDQGATPNKKTTRIFFFKK
jgi:hypothetical protein